MLENDGMDTKPLLQVEGLKKYYTAKSGIFSRNIGEIRAVDGVSFSIHKGETLGLVGESGCGKSTLGRQIVGLEQPTGGRILYKGRDLSHMRKPELKAIRTQLQMVFQDSYSSLNPRKHIFEILAEPMLYHGLADSRELFDHPLHPYSKALFDAVPLADPRTRKRLGGGVIEGEAEILPGPGEGCPFYPRCPRRSRECAAARMELRPASEGSSHLVSCIHAGQEGVD